MSDLWGGRFAEPLDAALRRFSTSLPVDRRLAREDLRVSRVHAEGLRDAGLLPESEHRALVAALERIEGEVAAGTFPPADGGPSPPEDIHSAIEARLITLAGDAALRLHAGRSRNDQVVTDVLLWLQGSAHELEEAVVGLERALLAAAERHRDVLAYAHTHLQRAQPVLVAHWLLAHVEALDRDRGRIGDARRRADRSPLGAGACAGSSLALDREASARRLGFSRVAVNSIDAVSDRDFAVELTAACALTMAHLSRLAEDLVIGASQEFATVRLTDAWSTGSSMMPQKRNPDVAELVRGKSGRVFGRLVALLTLLKGLPLSYNRDLQEDKEALFDAVDTTRDSARLLAGAVASATFLETQERGPDFSSATDLAEELVRRGVPFRTAHERIGVLVRTCERDGRGLPEASADELAAAGLEGLDRKLLTARGSIEAKRTLGSTSPGEVARALEGWRARLG